MPGECCGGTRGLWLLLLKILVGISTQVGVGEWVGAMDCLEALSLVGDW